MAGFEESKVPRCSFCGKPEYKVNRLLYGNGAFICDECVSLCYQMLVDDGLLRAPSVAQSHSMEEMTFLKPREIKAVLDEYVIGQDDAKIALAVAVYNHYKRIFVGEDDGGVELQ